MATRRTTWVLAVLAGVVCGATVRLWPLYWSPYPATLDGFGHAARARATLAGGHVPMDGFRADAFGSTLWLGSAAEVTGIGPLALAQPLYALFGTAVVLVGVAFARRVARARGWPDRRVAAVTALAAIAIAVDGVLVARTGVPDDDALTLVLVPLRVLAAARYARSGRRAWAAVAGLLVLVLPITHTFSTLLAALALTALAAAIGLGGGIAKLGGGAATDRPGAGRRAAAVAVALWAVTAGYYGAVPATSLVVPYAGRVLAHAGLFLAWLIVLVAAVPWFRRRSEATQRVLVAAPLALFVVVLAANATLSVFPGTARTPPLVLGLALPFVVVIALAAVASPRLGDASPASLALLALLAAPAVHLLYDLTAAPTPDFFATALRAQSHLHLPAVVLAALAAVGLLQHRSESPSTNDGPERAGEPDPPIDAASPVGDESTARAAGRWRRRAGALAVLGLLAALVVTLPLGYVHFDTGTVPATTTEGDYAAISFAATSISGAWTSEQPAVAVARHRGEGSDARLAPTVSWLAGGQPPACATLSWAYWGSSGAHLFPVAPAALSPGEYDRVVGTRDRVYDGGAYDRAAVTLPRDSDQECESAALPAAS